MNKVMHNFARVSICIVCIIFLASLISLGLIFNSNTNSAHAVNPQSVDYNVYVKPSLNVSISSNSVVLNINPAGSLNGSNNPNNFASNNLNVSVATNNQYGYRLYMNSNTSDLVKTDDNTEIIPTLSTSTTESNFPYNKWGYKFSTDTDYQPFQANTNIPISSSDTATNEITRTLNFGAKANYDKKAGTYELDLNFKALPQVTTYYMQDIAKDSTLAESVCTEEPTVVIDKRDEKAYTIRRIGGDATHPGDCWMVENLQFTGTTMDSTTSNISPQYTPANPYVATYYDLVDEGGTNGKCNGSEVAGGVFSYACIKEGNTTTTNSPIDDSITSTQIGTVWYNYVAASAGTITGEVNTNPQIYDICPAGWKIPTSTEHSKIINTVPEFNRLYGGFYSNGTPSYTQYGYWWTSTTATTGPNGARSGFRAYAGTETINHTNIGRQYAAYIRCIMKDPDITNLNYMQDFAKVTPAEKTMIINNSDEHQTVKLKDSRENSVNSYWVGKLKDGKVWMVQNLKLGSSGSSVTLTSADSNISASSWTLNGKVAAPGKFTTYTTCAVGSCEDRRTSTTYYNNNNAYYCTPVSGDTNQYVGCYYNWYSATASSGTSSTTPVSTSIGYKDVNSSICPKGWYLPTGGGAPLSGSTSDRPDSDFNVLYNNYPSASEMLVSNPTTTYDNTTGQSRPGLLLSGLYYSSGALGLGQSSHYWSRSAYSKGSAYLLYLNSSAVNPQYYGDKYFGFSVRCLVYPN